MSNPFENIVKDSGVKAKATKDDTVKRIAAIVAAVTALRASKVKATHRGLLIVPKGYASNAKVQDMLATAAKSNDHHIVVHEADVLTVKGIVEAACKEAKAKEFDHFTVGKNARAYLIG